MKAKIGEIELEGTAQEIGEFYSEIQQRKEVDVIWDDIPALKPGKVINKWASKIEKDTKNTIRAIRKGKAKDVLAKRCIQKIHEQGTKEKMEKI